MKKLEKEVIIEVRNLLNSYRHVMKNAAEGDTASLSTLTDCMGFMAQELEEASGKLYSLLYPEDAAEFARVRGANAFLEGISCAPALDAEFISWIEKRRMPLGSNAPLYKAWTEGWTARNLSR